jgi:hypothetical protein
LTSGFAAFEPFGLSPATRAAPRKNESSRFAFFFGAKAANRTFRRIAENFSNNFSKNAEKTQERDENASPGSNHPVSLLKIG